MRVIGWIFCVPALLIGLSLSVLRVFQPEGGTAVRLVSFTPFAVGAYAVALLVALILLRRSARRVLALVAVAGLVLHGWWLAPLWMGSNPPPAADASPIVVMSANLLRGEADPYELVHEVSSRGVDLLALNEVTPAALAEMDRSGLTELLPHRAGAPTENVEGTMLLSAYPLSGERTLPTGFGSLAVDVDIDGTMVRALAVHPRPPIEDAREWRDDLAVVADETPDADLVLGDFNATLDHEPLRALMGERLRDAVEATNGGFAPTWPVNETWGLPMPLVQIDHVLTGGRLSVLGAERVEVEGTDHAFVVAEVALR